MCIRAERGEKLSREGSTGMNQMLRGPDHPLCGCAPHLCSTSLYILSSCSDGQQQFWGKGGQVKFRRVWGEMVKGRGKAKFHGVLARQT